MEPQDGMEGTILFSVEVRDRMGVTGTRVDLESKIPPQESPGLWPWVEIFGA